MAFGRLATAMLVRRWRVIEHATNCIGMSIGGRSVTHGSAARAHGPPVHLVSIGNVKSFQLAPPSEL